MKIVDVRAHVLEAQLSQPFRSSPCGNSTAPNIRSARRC